MAINLSNKHTQNWLKQTGNLLVGDVAGMSMEAFYLANYDRLNRMFPVVENVGSNILTGPIRYYQKPIEQALEYTVNFEGEEYHKARLSKPPEQRVDEMANTAFRYLSAIGIGWATTIGTEKTLARIVNAPKVPTKFYFMDMATHAGLIALMTTPVMTPVVDRAKKVVKAAVQAMGVEEERSEDISRIAVVSGIPNYTVLGLVSHKLYKHNHKLEDLSKQLKIGSSLSQHI